MGSTTFSGPVTSTNGFIGEISGASGLTTTAGAGITGGTGTVYTSQVQQTGNIVTTYIFIDLTGLSSSAAADIIGVEATAACHLGAIDFAESGTPFAGRVSCIETPATGEPDIDLYSAVEATGTEDAAITGLDETALLAAAADWTGGASQALTAVPADGEYLYLVGSGAGTDAVYTAGQFLITIEGYLA
jgi:hypothetical protein